MNKQRIKKVRECFACLTIGAIAMAASNQSGVYAIALAPPVGRVVADATPPADSPTLASTAN